VLSIPQVQKAVEEIREKIEKEKVEQAKILQKKQKMEKNSDYFLLTEPEGW
jgi:hypothetical protein